MTTRLDRLFLLLDTGSTPLIRKSAAEQLGEVQKLHPYELQNLLSKVHGYLKSSSWETRIAAGQAVAAIARNVPKWNKNIPIKQETNGNITEGNPSQLLFTQFNIGKVLSQGASLLGAEEKQYETEMLSMNDKDQLSRQRQILNKRLGLDMAGNLGIGGDIFSDEDLVSQIKTENGDTFSDKRSVSDILKQQLLDVTGGKSAREQSRMKRKAKILAKQRSKDCYNEQMSLDTEPPCKKAKSHSVDMGSGESKLVMEASVDIEEDEEWYFESFCELLMNDLFNSRWETRHGAATGLREVIRIHGDSAGLSIDIPQDQLHTINQVWLTDLALRLLCVLSLDRFGDYVSDEVVAPVRETSAQTLGMVIKHLDRCGVEGMVNVLLQLLAQEQWEVRHGGLLGFKYLLAVRQDMTDRILPVVLPSLFRGLQDVDDDVRAVAAAALVPVAHDLVHLLPQQVPLVLTCLWDTLLDLDDLTASTNSIMTLLSTILTNPQASVKDWLSQPLPELVPRLWPFLRHSIASVRQSALETFHTLLTIPEDQQTIQPWLPFILQDALRHVFQRCLLEEKENIIQILERVWTQLLFKAPLEYLVGNSLPWLGVWLCLCMQPSKLPFDSSYLIEAKHRGRLHSDGEHGKTRHCIGTPQKTIREEKDYIAGTLTLNASVVDRDMAVMRTRIMATKFLGMLCSYIIQEIPNFPPEGEKPVTSLSKLFLFHLNSKSAVQRFVIGQVVYNLACSNKESKLPDEVVAKLLECLSDAIYFDEVAISFTHMQSDCRDFMAGLKQNGVDLDSVIPPGGIITLDQASVLTTTTFDQAKASLKPKAQQVFEERRKQLKVIVDTTIQELQTLTIRVQCSLAKAAVELGALPEKLNPVIRPLMECIKKEQNQEIQQEAADCLCRLIKKCLDKNPNPNSKVLKNLCTFLCVDPTYTPRVTAPIPSYTADESEVKCGVKLGIITLTKQQKTPNVGKKWLKRAASVKIDDSDSTQEINETQKQHQVQRRGATLALTTITQKFGDELPDSLPTLWENMVEPLQGVGKENILTEDKAQELVNSLQVLETLCTVMTPNLQLQLRERLPLLLDCLHSQFVAVRHLAARCFGMLCQVMTLDLMTFIIEKIVPLMDVADNVIYRQGATEALACVIDGLGMDLIPYIVLLVVQVLRRMSDQDEAVRLMATACFASLIRLMPLEAGITDPPEMSEALVAEKEKQRKFLEQLMDGSKLESYDIVVPVKAELRKYQQDGVNWLAFLNKYNLHGILCDDMGLGKTLQSICIMASDHKLRDEKYKETESMEFSPLPSIVICPPTLIGHWVYEVNKFVDIAHLNPLMYAGPPGERARIQKKVKKHNLIVASYDVVRNDIDFFSTISWNYCILDEGHVIKNGKTKLSKAVKQLVCNHRLILSGTPIQNNVLDLWSLFDFLLPGFLGTEKQFQARYGKPILQSRDAKSTSKEQEAGALAMESLHRQVLPFILRRLKEDVLQDLPPKIIQDYYCDLSPLQTQLYEDFAKSRAKQGLEDSVTILESSDSKERKSAGATHVFQALQYLRKLCNHPALVLTASHPKYEEVTKQLKTNNSSLRDCQHAPKLNALKQLLIDCGIGVAMPTNPGSGSQLDTDLPVVNQHRVLLFCQLKSMLNIVEEDLLKSQMPSVTYLRLDGSIPAGSRQQIVNRFNNDPSIDILLLTTHVGGLGLNLTGADTVIFVEHDWNPMKDLQAMDRAHRIGQKKVVNVYRLITRGTLEEKIMGLQKFKMTIANTIISQDNSSLQTMGTDQLLDLFSLDDQAKGQVIAPSGSSGSDQSKRESIKSILENLGDLWDEKEYESEYNLDNFIKSLKK
ncbi:TATA-binding protein-associated factor 172-like [Saccostrea echinata]|uniref:TATA-binding protein-associated factor 172-like n=1 Tax=Saccostrea echinata TaxID=191078 RepID=UPI002A80EB9D|nr:TATA-binding protein-associated factor 172-like [Saccostrea echinata]